MTTPISMSVSDKDLCDLLCSGMEGGINYWATIVEYKKPPAMPFRTDPQHLYKHLDYPMNPGGAVIIVDSEEQPEVRHELTYEKLQKGLQIMAEKFPRHFADFKSENADATTGDVLVQCALFGEIVYG